MRLLLKIFALLDVISIVLLVPQLWSVIFHYDQMNLDQWFFIKIIVTALIFFSLFISAAGLFRMKKYGIITYYIQFPFRIVCWVFSIGFITLIPELLNLGTPWLGILFRICVIGEFFRVYFTLQLHRKYFRNLPA